MLDYPDFAETCIAAIALNRAKEHRGRVKYLSMYHNGRHVGAWHKVLWDDSVDQQLRLAAAWQKLGFKPGEKVAIIGKNRPRWADAFSSLPFARLVAVPVYPTLTPADTLFVLADSGARAAVVDTLEQAKKVLSIKDRLPALEKIFVMDPLDPRDDLIGAYDDLLASTDGPIDRNALTAAVHATETDDPVAIIYTSGTTGRPKGVVLTNGNFLSQRVVLPSFNLNADDVFLNHLPFCHSFGLTADLLASADVGAVLAIADGIANEQIRHALGTIRPTVLMSVPRLFEKLYVEVQRVVSAKPAKVQKIFRGALAIGKEVFDLRNEGRPLPLGLRVKYRLAKRILGKVRRQAGLDNVRIAYAGGAPTSRLLCYFFQSLGIDIYQGYGLTETSPICNVNVPGKNKLGTVGPPISGVDQCLGDDGEILIRGPNVMLGYHENDEATREVIDAEGWFHSGDIGFFDDDGYLSITDRKKEILVTSGGKNIAPLRIECAFNTEQYIERVVVIGDDRKYLTALVCPNLERLRDWAGQRGLAFSTDGQLAALPEVRDLLQKSIDKVNASLARYEQIKKFAVIDYEFTEETGELTPTMKVKRRVVDQRHKTVIDTMYPS